ASQGPPHPPPGGTGRWCFGGPSSPSEPAPYYPSAYLARALRCSNPGGGPLGEVSVTGLATAASSSPTTVSVLDLDVLRTLATHASSKEERSRSSAWNPPSHARTSPTGPWLGRHAGSPTGPWPVTRSRGP